MIVKQENLTRFERILLVFQHTVHVHILSFCKTYWKRGCLRGSCSQYERNRATWPLVYRLSDKAGRAAKPFGVSAESI